MGKEKTVDAKTLTTEFVVTSVSENEVRLSHDKSVSTVVLRQSGAAKMLNRGDVVDVVMTVRAPEPEEKIVVEVPASDASKLPNSAEAVK